MKIPQSIKIGFKDYQVNVVDTLDDCSQLLFGEVNYHEERINICNRYCLNQQKCTLIHEVIHGIDDFMDIRLHENQVVKLAKGLYQVVKDNPEMFEGVNDKAQP